MKKFGRFIGSVWSMFLVLLRDLTGLAGMASISYGAWLTYPPAGFIVAGVLLAGVAFLMARSEQT